MLLAIDPGPHTGVFADSRRNGYPGHWAVTLDLGAEATKAGGWSCPHEYLYDWLDSHHDTTTAVILEKFEYQKEKAQTREHLNFDAAEYVGVVKLWCAQRNLDLILQSPSTVVSKEGKTFWNDDKLKRVGLWRGMDRHARDAARHYLYYVTFTLKDNTWLEKLR